MSTFKGDFLGFTYNGKHSSKLGIFRTSNGSRFEENLLPTMQDKTVQVPGNDGTYYFGSHYTQRQFTIPFAFDALTEEQLRELRMRFGDKKIHDLIFDESPYKVYSAKVTGTATLKYIPFDVEVEVKRPENGEENEEENATENATENEEENATVKKRIYKGEGSITFTCYYPFARSRYKYLSQYQGIDTNDWAAASGMLETQGDFDVIDFVTKKIKLYNPGNEEADWILHFSDISNFSGCTLSINGVGELVVSEFKLKTTKSGITDTKITIDSKTNLIEGWYNIGTEGNPVWKKTGNLYNEYITSGDFFKIPVIIDKDNGLEMTVNQGYTHPRLEYNYLYL